MSLVVNGVTIIGVVIDLAITGIEQQLEERVGMRIGSAGAHLHGQQEKKHETQDAGQCEQPASVQTSEPSRG